VSTRPDGPFIGTMEIEVRPGTTSHVDHQEEIIALRQRLAELERELETWSLNCTKRGLDVHWVGGLGVSPGQWAHGEPAPHGEPAV
jgi:hypothetical protein